jgi:transposase InsO family protein
MKTLQGEYAIGELCAAFDVSRSGFHRWRTAEPCKRAREDARISEVLRAVHLQSRDTYGRPRLVAALRQLGYRCSPKRVARLMRACKLRGVQRGIFRPQTTQSADRTPAPNLLLRRKAASVPGQVWVADITFIPTKEGWLYLAGVMDQASRRILGMAFDSRLDASLCLTALRQALSAQPQQRQRLIHHSDQGYQYASTCYRELLRQKQILQSMSRKANCYDNAHIESFWATLKTEGLPRQSYSTRAEARLAVFDYVHTFYNRVRLHSALRYKSPVDFEQQTH